MKKVITLDFSECCYLGEVYEVIRRELELPEWFGANPDALWDALTGIAHTSAEIRVLPQARRSELLPEIEEIIAVFQEAAQTYQEISVTVL